MFQTLVFVLFLRHKSCGFCLFMKLLQRLAAWFVGLTVSWTELDVPADPKMSITTTSCLMAFTASTEII